MLQIDDALKELYKADSTPKQLILDFYHPGEDEAFLHISDSGNIMSETMEIDESLSSDENIEFGSCEATQFKITLVDVTEDLKDSYMVVYQTLEGIFPAEDLYPEESLYPDGYTMPLGRYVVQSADKQANRKYRDVVALDFMSKFDVNVIDWYNALTFPMTLRAFRASLCKHVGVKEEVPDYLPNDDMLVDKTIDTAELIGRNVLIAIEQANGVFGHFDRNGTLKHIALQPNDRLAPSTDLYPSDDLYPLGSGGENDQVYDDQLDPYLLISCKFEEYTVKSIDKVQIRQEEGDIGAIYGEGTNAYTVEGNFLMYGKTSDELAVLAQNIYGMVSGRTYIPFESSTKGLPYLEVGDAARFEFGADHIVSYIIKRTLKGIYALKDSYSATGDEIRGVQTNINTDIIQLKGRAAIIKKSVDEVSVNLINLEKNVQSQFSVTAEEISSLVKRQNEAESSIRQTAEEIALKVSKGDVSAQLSIESGGIDIKGDRFSWTSTNSSLTADGYLKVIKGEFSGSINVGDGNFTVDENGNVVAKSITVGTTSSRSVIYGSTVLASKMTVNDSFSVDCYASMADIGANTISCDELNANEIYGEVNPFSDKRLKKNIEDISAKEAMTVIKELRPVSFAYKKNGRESIGFIAQEVQKICEKNRLGWPLYGMHGNYYTIPYINYIPLIVSALQELIADMERRNSCTE